MNDLLLLQLVGVKVVLVHGGGPDINSTLEAMHIESKFSNGLRVTDKETMNVVQWCLLARVNKGLVGRPHTALVAVLSAFVASMVNSFSTQEK